VDSVTPTTLVSREMIEETPGASRATSFAAITDYVPGAYMCHDMLHMRGGHQTSWLIDGSTSPTPTLPRMWVRRSLLLTPIKLRCSAEAMPPTSATVPTASSTSRLAMVLNATARGVAHHRRQLLHRRNCALRR